MKRFRRFLLWFLLLVLTGGCVVSFTPLRQYLPYINYRRFTPEEYTAECRQVRLEAQQTTTAGRKELLRAAIAERIFRHWEGTRWGFNGTSEIPGKGQIACGYFVTTVLRDCGVPLQRVKLAQQASETIIKTLVSEKQIRRYSHISLSKFVNEVKQNGDQVYIVGLDTHVGFLVCEKGQVWFIHSSGSYPWKVTKEVAINSTVLNLSRYRVTGCLTNDDHFMQRWADQL